MNRLARDWFKLLPISFMGVVLGHIYLYRWLFPESGHRHTELASTGHGYFPIAIVMAAGLSIVSLVLYAWLGHKEKATGTLHRKPSFGKTIAVLFAVQCLTFVGMELVERFASGGSHAVRELLGSVILPLGIILQLATAALTALLLGAAHAVGRWIAALVAAVIHPACAIIAVDPLYIRILSACCFVIRGPPATSRYSMY